MQNNELATWLLHNTGFNKQYRELVMSSVLNNFPCILTNCNSTSDHNFQYMLLSASLLAQSSVADCQDAALRIAQFVLLQSSISPLLKDAAIIILDILANKPAIQLAHKRGLVNDDIESRIPFGLYQDWIKRSLENVVRTHHAKDIPVNHFQKEFWTRANQSTWLSLSAPTSAGKSYIMSRWIVDYFRANNKALVVYIVPTRALIHQVQLDIELLLKGEQLEGIPVSVLPLKESIISNQSQVLVFTQERLHILLAEYAGDLAVDMLIIDEAQKVGDGYRGVLLQQAIECVVESSPQCRVLFASPMTLNPELLLDDAPKAAITSSMISSETVVNQNLLLVSQVPKKPMNWNAEFVFNGQRIPFGAFVLSDRPSPDSKRLPYIAYTLGSRTGGNLVYVNGAADAEKTAKQLYELVGNEPLPEIPQEVRDLIDLCKKVVHSKFALSSVLSRGIAFHYGNMPLLIRSEIERLFREGMIRYLVCTSTLVEGVNLPCQSIFLRGPTKGRGVPMSPTDFWNLAGRAGRWGKEFQGNIICVDAHREDVWKRGIPMRKEHTRIDRSTDVVLSSIDSLIAFIEKGAPRDQAQKEPLFEHVFSYLCSCFIRNGTLKSTRWATRYGESSVDALERIITNIVATLRVPQQIVTKNPGISPLAMNSLFDYFEERATDKNKSPDELLPVLPESEDAFESYVQILYRINDKLAHVFGSGGRVKQLTMLIVQWMRGYPLSRLIVDREKHYGSDNLAETIRNTMKDIEEVARFLAPKYLSCYTDVLSVHLSNIKRSDLQKRLFGLNVLLEFGVSQQTQLSLMGLGLSRSTAIAISEYTGSTTLTENACLVWLREQDWITRDLPKIMKREIDVILAQKK